MSVDQFEEAKEANQKMKIQQWTNKRKLAESWRYCYLGSSLQKIESRVLIDKSAVMRIHVLSGWLASSDPIRRAFIQRIGLPFRIKEKLDCCMDVCSSYRVRQWFWTWKAFLSIKTYFYRHPAEYEYYYQRRKWNMPDFWNRHDHSLPKVYLFFPPSRFSLLSSGRFLCCLPHFAPTASWQKRAAKKSSLPFEHNAKH